VTIVEQKPVINSSRLISIIWSQMSLVNNLNAVKHPHALVGVNLVTNT